MRSNRQTLAPGNLNEARSIFVVDDERFLCESIALMLKREFAHMTIRHTTNPSQAKEWLEQKAPALLLTDLRMPRISGLELLSFALERWHDMPAIVMTASPSEELYEAVSQDMAHYLPKPFRHQALQTLIRDILENKPTRPSSGSTPSPMLAEVIRFHSHNQSTGILVVDTPSEQGEIHFVEGQITTSHTYELQGPEALKRILSWKMGRFYFLPSTNPPAQLTPHSSLLSQKTPAPDDGQSQIAEYHVPYGKELDVHSLNTIFEGFSSLELDAIRKADKHHEIPSVSSILAQQSGTFNISPAIVSEEAYDNQPRIASSFALCPHNLDTSLKRLQQLEGFMGACIGNKESILATLGDTKIDWQASIEAHCASFTKAGQQLAGITEQVTEIVLRTKENYHILLLSKQDPSIFFSLLLDRQKANLALARLTIVEVDQQLVMTAPIS